VDARDHNTTSTARDAALSEVFAYREARPSQAHAGSHGSRSLRRRAACRVHPDDRAAPRIRHAGAADRASLLAVEADWAARAYAWTDWRFTQMRDWFHRQSRLFRWAIVVGLLLVAAAIVWLLIEELV
jgi:hypothetical protein